MAVRGKGVDGERAPIETARYIADLTTEMSVLARRAGLDVVAYLLDMAKAEAEANAEPGNVIPTRSN